MADQGEFRQRRGKATARPVEQSSPATKEIETGESSIISIVVEGILGKLNYNLKVKIVAL